MNKLLRMQGIYKSFGGVHALTDACLEVERGEIHALLGENGAGKSTLMNILTGVIQRDGGYIEFDGKEYPFPSIRQMQDAGIAFVHQELSVIKDLSVYENIFLNREIKGRFGILNKAQMIKEAKELFVSLGIELDPLAPASSLKPSEKQLLEICRALHKNAKLLILDEPTTTLNNEEIGRLFEILGKKRDEGVSFVFISHKMPEIFALADRYTVFRNGRFVSAGYIKDTDARRVTSDMIGREYAEGDVYSPRPLGDIAVKLDKLTAEGFRDVDLTLQKGEIVALTGLAGSGASEVLQCMFGVIPIQGGSIEIHGKNVRGGIARFMKNKVAMLPSDRKDNSVIPDMSIVENCQIAEHTLSYSRPFINRSRERKRFGVLCDMLSIRADSPDSSITSLSGGNQQKVFLARWLNTNADVLIFDNPTQGVDVGAKAEIYELILGFAREGKAVLINSQEIQEIQKIADRCIVFYGGEISRILSHGEINERDVMLYSTGAAKEA